MGSIQVCHGGSNLSWCHLVFTVYSRKLNHAHRLHFIFIWFDHPTLSWHFITISNHFGFFAPHHHLVHTINIACFHQFLFCVRDLHSNKTLIRICNKLDYSWYVLATCFVRRVSSKHIQIKSNKVTFAPFISNHILQVGCI